MIVLSTGRSNFNSFAQMMSVVATFGSFVSSRITYQKIFARKKCVLRKINVRLMFLKSLLGKAQLPLKQKRQNNKHSWKWYIHHFCSTFVCTNQNEKYQIPTQNCLIISICVPSVTRKLSVMTNLCQL